MLSNLQYSEGRFSAFVGAYAIHHVATGKRYVGSTNHLKRRQTTHMRDLKLNRHPNLFLQAAYNWDPRLEWFFVITEDREQAYEYEQVLINIHQPKGELFNISGDARTAFVALSEESEMRRRAKLKGLKRSPEHREAIRQSKLGVKRSPEMVEFLRQRQLGKKYSLETRQKQSAMRKGKKMPPRTQEHIDKIRKAKEGFRHTPESIARIRAGSVHSRPVSVDGVTYPSVSELIRTNGFDFHKADRWLRSPKHPTWFYL